MAKASTQCRMGFVLRGLVAAAVAAVALEGTALAQVTGTITATPPVATAGQQVLLTYSVRNDGNTEATLPLFISLIDPDTNMALVEFTDTATLPPGGVYTNMKTLDTTGLAPKTYDVALDVVLEGRQRLATARLQIVAATLDCSGAGPAIGELWPPNHKFVGVGISGVNDAAGNPADITIDAVFQDEPVNSLGDGNTCPDAVGTGTAHVGLRSERSGLLDGRIYHLRFTATDPAGGSCQGEVTVCVPHDQGGKPQCIDQGPLFNSTACPQGRPVKNKK